jgi:hypothetical protein
MSIPTNPADMEPKKGPRQIGDDDPAASRAYAISRDAYERYINEVGSDSTISSASEVSSFTIRPSALSHLLGLLKSNHPTARFTPPKNFEATRSSIFTSDLIIPTLGSVDALEEYTKILSNQTFKDDPNAKDTLDGFFKMLSFHTKLLQYIKNKTREFHRG